MPDVGPVHWPLRMALRASSPVCGKSVGWRCWGKAGMAFLVWRRQARHADASSPAILAPAGARCPTPGYAAERPVAGALSHRWALAPLGIDGSLSPRKTLDGGGFRDS